MKINYAENLTRYGFKYFDLQLIGIALSIWLLIRIPNLNDTYHQDEYKWAINLKGSGLDSLPHPPFVPFVYNSFGNLFGFHNLRIIVLLFSLILFLVQIFAIVKYLDTSTAIIYSFAVAVNPYAAIMSTQIDIDGTFLPLIQTLFLILLIERKHRNSSTNTAALLLILILGYLIKLSFIISVVTFIFSAFLISSLRSLRLQAIQSLLASFVIVFLIKNLFPYSFSYVDNFLSSDFLDRSWSQVFVLSSKVVLLIGPLLFIFLLKDAMVSKLAKIVFIWTAINLLWYLVIFDFSERAIDRYLQSLTYPAVLLFSHWCSKLFVRGYLSSRTAVFLVSLSALSVPLLLASTDYETMSLYPKNLYIERFFSLDWNFLFPLFTASGPLGFFFSFKFLVIYFLVAAFLIFLCNFTRISLACSQLFVCLVAIYSFSLSLENSFGVFYGNSTSVVRELVQGIDSNQKVLTYNDIAAYELIEKDSYAGRLYMRPDWQEGKKEIMKDFDGTFMYVNMPPIESAKWLFEELDRCSMINEVTDGRIVGRLYDCSLNMSD